MKNESMDRMVEAATAAGDAPEATDATKKRLVIQPGSPDSQISDATDAYRAAGQKVVGLSEGKVGDVDETLDGTRLEQKLSSEASGKDEVIFDMSRTESLGDAQMEKILDDRDMLDRKGVDTKVTGLTDAQKLAMKAKGGETKRTKLFTKLNTRDALAA